MAESKLNNAKKLLEEANQLLIKMKQNDKSLANINIIPLGLQIETAIGNIDKVRRGDSTNTDEELSTAITNLNQILKSVNNFSQSESKNNLVAKINAAIEQIKPTQGGKRKPLTACTVSELKAKAKKRGINVTGLKKAEIIAKLRRR